MSSLKEINGKYYQQCKVVMLATNKSSHIHLLDGSIWHYKTQDSVSFGASLAQHLYILSDEEIEEGDWCICLDEIEKHPESALVQQHLPFSCNGCKKIIATTDTSLRLAQPSQSFIQKYIEEYNKGSVIENVLVEYETYIHNPQTNEEWHSTNQLWAEDCEFQKRLKTDSDNTITIKKVKNSYSREEVKELLSQIYDLGYDHGCESLGGKIQETLSYDNWIKENL